MKAGQLWAPVSARCLCLCKQPWNPDRLTCTTPSLLNGRHRISKDRESRAFRPASMALLRSQTEAANEPAELEKILELCKIFEYVAWSELKAALK